MNAYVTHGWENFFVAEAGASAALSGLLFVAVSINLARVLETPYLPLRAHVTPRQRMMNVVLVQLATLPLLVAGATLFFGSGGGLYWVVPFTLLSIVAAVFDAWVLLIEIMR